MLTDLMSRHDLVAINTLDMCDGAEFSNVPFNSDRETLIDHILIHANDMTSITSCSILDDHCLNVSSHRPLTCVLNCLELTASSSLESYRSINWKNVKQCYIDQYRICLNSDLKLNRAKFNQIESTEDIDRLYGTIVTSINDATNKMYPEVQI